MTVRADAAVFSVNNVDSDLYRTWSHHSGARPARGLREAVEAILEAHRIQLIFVRARALRRVFGPFEAL